MWGGLSSTPDFTKPAKIFVFDTKEGKVIKEFTPKIPGVEKLLQYEIVSYLVFGVLTTVVNFVVFAAADFKEIFKTYTKK